MPRQCSCEENARASDEVLASRSIHIRWANTLLDAPSLVQLLAVAGGYSSGGFPCNAAVSGELDSTVC
jgi:hypothetical protein